MFDPVSSFIIHRRDFASDLLVVERDGLSIGADLNNDLVLNHPTVSRLHAGIREVKGNFWLINLSQANGTLVNGGLCDIVQLQSGDSIQIGIFVLAAVIEGRILNLYIERCFDAFAAGNRMSQILGDPLQATAEGRMTLMVHDIRGLFDAPPEPKRKTPKATQVIDDSRPTTESPKSFFSGFTQEIEANFDSLSSRESEQISKDRDALLSHSKKTAISVSELRKFISRKNKKAQIPSGGQPLLVPLKDVKLDSDDSQGVMRRARMQRGMTGLLTSIMELPESERAEFQQSMNVFWERRKQAQIDRQSHHEESLVRPQKPAPELMDHNLHLGKKRYNWLPTNDLVWPWPRGFLTWLLVGLGIFLTGLAFLWQESLVPGPTSAPHALTAPDLDRQFPQVIQRLNHQVVARELVENSCSKCHQAGGSMQTQCADCHRTSHFNPTIIPPHQKADVGCIDCHTEHKGVYIRPGHVSRSQCMDCHSNEPRHPKALKPDGKPLGAPHGGTIGYPIVDGEWKWTKPLNSHLKLPDSLSPKEKFHLVHAIGAGGQPWKCSGCHTSFASAAETKKISTAGCAICHSVSFAAPSNRQLDATAAETRMDCASCHPQHGEDEALLAFHLPQNNQKEPMIYIPDGVYRGGTDWEWTSFAAHFGGLSFAGWGLFLLLAPIVVTGFFGWDAFRRLKILGRLTGSVITEEANRRRFTDTHYAEKWESLTQRHRARDSAEAFPFPHPVINYETCIGCHACILACPQDVLGFDDQEHHAVVVNYEQCMEDTGCQQACPTVPQSCVLINTKRTITEPPKPLRKGAGTGFETENIPGIHLIGDVSGVPLIRNAIKEGRIAIDRIMESFQREGRAPGAHYDVAIIGIGPAGIAATARAAERRLSYLALEQGRKYATIAEKYPAGKYVAFNPFVVGEPTLGSIRLEGPGEVKETMIAWWEEAVAGLGLTINEFEGCKDIIQEGPLFRVVTAKNPTGYLVRKVVVAIGNSGEPRKLGVPGEQEDRVLYRLRDPKEIQSKHVLVVGAGNSAVEAAVDLAGERQSNGTVVYPESGGNAVTIVIRSDFPKDLTLENKMWIYDCIDKGLIKAYFGAQVREIGEVEVVIESVRDKKEIARVPNHLVFAMIGSIPPREFLSRIGIKYAGK
ncbi:MAG: NAD(P)-binding domain-containing protein [Blastocatellia bacterium]|nr:NAD(P)-binding domain-containing protein [Blastocatellia bacterium]